MITLTIILVIFFLVTMWLFRRLYCNSHRKIGERFMLSGREFRVVRYDPTCQLSRCRKCDMQFFPLAAGYKNGKCTKAPFCSEDERRDKINVYFELVNKYSSR